MDPFEEFEFKPLTEGLGFHNRTNANQHRDSSRTLNFSDTDLDLVAPDTAEMLNNPQIQAPLPRKEKDGAAKSPSGNKSTSNNTVDEILKTLGERRKYDFTETPSLRHDPGLRKNEIFASSSFEISAALLDGMLIVASYLASMIILLMITKIDLFANLVNADENNFVYLSLFALLAAISWIYLVANRLFLGFTPGEWVFDQRLGLPEQLGTADYSMKVALRSFVVLATGFIFIPVASMLLRRDWLGRMMGVELLKKV